MEDRVPARRVIGLAVPALGVLAAEPLYVLVDTAVVGHLGALPLAGLALGGSYFSLVLDSNRSEAEPDDNRIGGRQTAEVLALSTLPVGLSYYRLSESRLRRSSVLGTAQLDRLTTHSAGITVVQSLGQYAAVGSTFRWVRGYAASGLVPAGDRALESVLCPREAASPAGGRPRRRRLNVLAVRTSSVRTLEDPEG